MDFHCMKRQQLQALCKKHGIPANKSNLEMADLLASTLKVKENQPIQQHVDAVKEGKDVQKQSKKAIEDLPLQEQDDAVEDTEDVLKKPKKVRFSPNNEIREYEPSANKVSGRRRTRSSKDQDEDESISTVGVSRRKRGREEGNKVDSESSKSEGPVIRQLRSGKIINEESTKGGQGDKIDIVKNPTKRSSRKRSNEESAKESIRVKEVAEAENIMLPLKRNVRKKNVSAISNEVAEKTEVTIGRVTRDKAKAENDETTTGRVTRDKAKAEKNIPVILNEAAENVEVTTCSFTRDKAKAEKNSSVIPKAEAKKDQVTTGRVTREKAKAEKNEPPACKLTRNKAKADEMVSVIEDVLDVIGRDQEPQEKLGRKLRRQSLSLLKELPPEVLAEGNADLPTAVRKSKRNVIKATDSKPLLPEKPTEVEVSKRITRRRAPCSKSIPSSDDKVEEPKVEDEFTETVQDKDLKKNPARNASRRISVVPIKVGQRNRRKQTNKDEMPSEDTVEIDDRKVESMEVIDKPTSPVGHQRRTRRNTVAPGITGEPVRKTRLMADHVSRDNTHATVEPVKADRGAPRHKTKKTRSAAEETLGDVDTVERLEKDVIVMEIDASVVLDDHVVEHSAHEDVDLKQQVSQDNLHATDKRVQTNSNAPRRSRKTLNATEETLGNMDKAEQLQQDVIVIAKDASAVPDDHAVEPPALSEDVDLKQLGKSNTCQVLTDELTGDAGITAPADILASSIKTRISNGKPSRKKRNNSVVDSAMHLSIVDPNATLDLEANSSSILEPLIASADEGNTEQMLPVEEELTEDIEVTHQQTPGNKSASSIAAHKECLQFFNSKNILESSNKKRSTKGKSSRKKRSDSLLDSAPHINIVDDSNATIDSEAEIASIQLESPISSTVDRNSDHILSGVEVLAEDITMTNQETPGNKCYSSLNADKELIENCRSSRKAHASAENPPSVDDSDTILTFEGNLAPVRHNSPTEIVDTKQTLSGNKAPIEDTEMTSPNAPVEEIGFCLASDNELLEKSNEMRSSMGPSGRKRGPVSAHESPVNIIVTSNMVSDLDDKTPSTQLKSLPASADKKEDIINMANTMADDAKHLTFNYSPEDNKGKMNSLACNSAKVEVAALQMNPEPPETDVASFPNQSDDAGETMNLSTSDEELEDEEFSSLNAIAHEKDEPVDTFAEGESNSSAWNSAEPELAGLQVNSKPFEADVASFRKQLDDAGEALDLLRSAAVEDKGLSSWRVIAHEKGDPVDNSTEVNSSFAFDLERSITKVASHEHEEVPSNVKASPVLGMDTVIGVNEGGSQLGSIAIQPLNMNLVQETPKDPTITPDKIADSEEPNNFLQQVTPAIFSQSSTNRFRSEKNCETEITKTAHDVDLPKATCGNPSEKDIDLEGATAFGLGVLSDCQKLATEENYDAELSFSGTKSNDKMSAVIKSMTAKATDLGKDVQDLHAEVHDLALQEDVVHSPEREFYGECDSENTSIGGAVKISTRSTSREDIISEDSDAVLTESTFHSSETTVSLDGEEIKSKTIDSQVNNYTEGSGDPFFNEETKEVHDTTHSSGTKRPEDKCSDHGEAYSDADCVLTASTNIASTTFRNCDTTSGEMNTVAEVQVPGYDLISEIVAVPEGSKCCDEEGNAGTGNAATYTPTPEEVIRKPSYDPEAKLKDAVYLNEMVCSLPTPLRTIGCLLDSMHEEEDASKGCTEKVNTQTATEVVPKSSDEHGTKETEAAWLDEMDYSLRTPLRSITCLVDSIQAECDASKGCNEGGNTGSATEATYTTPQEAVEKQSVEQGDELREAANHDEVDYSLPTPLRSIGGLIDSMAEADPQEVVEKPSDEQESELRDVAILREVDRSLPISLRSIGCLVDSMQAEADASEGCTEGGNTRIAAEATYMPTPPVVVHKPSVEQEVKSKEAVSLHEIDSISTPLGSIGCMDNSIQAEGNASNDGGKSQEVVEKAFDVQEAKLKENVDLYVMDYCSPTPLGRIGCNTTQSERNALSMFRDDVVTSNLFKEMEEDMESMQIVSSSKTREAIESSALSSPLAQSQHNDVQTESPIGSALFSSWELNLIQGNMQCDGMENNFNSGNKIGHPNKRMILSPVDRTEIETGSGSFGAQTVSSSQVRPGGIDNIFTPISGLVNTAKHGEAIRVVTSSISGHASNDMAERSLTKSLTKCSEQDQSFSVQMASYSFWDKAEITPDVSNLRQQSVHTSYVENIQSQERTGRRSNASKNDTICGDEGGFTGFGKLLEENDKFKAEEHSGNKKSSENENFEGSFNRASTRGYLEELGSQSDVVPLYKSESNEPEGAAESSQKPGDETGSLVPSENLIDAESFDIFSPYKRGTCTAVHGRPNEANKAFELVEEVEIQKSTPHVSEKKHSKCEYQFEQGTSDKPKHDETGESKQEDMALEFSDIQHSVERKIQDHDSNEHSHAYASTQKLSLFDDSVPNTFLSNATSSAWSMKVDTIYADEDKSDKPASDKDTEVEEASLDQSPEVTSSTIGQGTSAQLYSELPQVNSAAVDQQIIDRSPSATKSATGQGISQLHSELRLGNSAVVGRPIIHESPAAAKWTTGQGFFAHINSKLPQVNSAVVDTQIIDQSPAVTKSSTGQGMFAPLDSELPQMNSDAVDRLTIVQSPAVTKTTAGHGILPQLDSELPQANSAVERPIIYQSPVATKSTTDQGLFAEHDLELPQVNSAVVDIHQSPAATKSTTGQDENFAGIMVQHDPAFAGDFLHMNSAVEKKKSRFSFIPGTPKTAFNSKGSMSAAKKEKFGTMTAPKPVSKRQPLGNRTNNPFSSDSQ